MADSGAPRFGVETVALDLPPLTAAFGRRLREAGVPVTPERSAEFARALDLVRPDSRRRLYAAARSVFLTDRAQGPAFDAVFREVFGDPLPTGPVPEEEALTVPAPSDDRPRSELQGRPAEASQHQPEPSLATSPASTDDDRDEEEGAELPLVIAGEDERLSSKSFDALQPDELARLYRLMSRLELATPVRRTRRSEHAHHGRRIDLRRTLRGSLRTGGDAVHVRRRRRRIVPRRLVLLCDISGSMEPYARAYLQFLSAATGSGRRVESFAFATRLTRLTRALATRSPERAIRLAAAAAPDWSSGTRIGAALKQFNDRYGRRGMARGAVIVVLSDGWERGDPELVGREMARLGRLAHKIIWVNPRLAARDFAVGAAGMRAAVEHCDSLLSGHNLEALEQVAEAIAEPPGSGQHPGELRLTADPGEPEQEEWASATPVPGSSVAMPSGYGPSRGKTTPGRGGG